MTPEEVEARFQRIEKNLDDSAAIQRDSETETAAFRRQYAVDTAVVSTRLLALMDLMGQTLDVVQATALAQQKTEEQLQRFLARFNGGGIR